jgi:putative transcriptional regulator
VAAPGLVDPNFLRVVIYLLDHDEGGSVGVVLNRPTDTAVEEVVPRWGLVVAQPQMVFRGGPVSVNGAICVARVADGEAERAKDQLGIGFGLAGDPDTDSLIRETLEAAAAAAMGREGPGVSEGGGGTGDDDHADLGADEQLVLARPPFQFIVGSVGTVDLHHAPEDVPVRLASARIFAGYAGWGPGQLDDEIEAGAWFVVESEEQDIFDHDPEQLWPRVLRRQPGWLRVLARFPLDPAVN